MNHQQQLLTKLSPKQQTLDFIAPGTWQQIPASQRRDCTHAVAELIFQVTQAKHNHEQAPNSMSQEDE